VNEEAATDLLLRFGVEGIVKSYSRTVFELGSAETEQLISETMGTAVGGAIP
jgi:hypothetical protein